jgi:RNA polymerase sigma-70 factor, ECF subfamily
MAAIDVPSSVVVEVEMPKAERKIADSSQSPDEGVLDADARLVRQLQCGDAEAGRRFVRDYYPGIYRSLLYLTGSRDLAEDLTQETFRQAWRNLDRFVLRAPLRAWLHRIAHREFLQALRSQRSQVSLEEMADLPAPRTSELTEAVELREIMWKLPIEEREVVALHYLQGYTCEEIAPIVRAPVSTVKYRLATARTHLQRELGEGDLAYLNEPGVLMRRWAWLPLDQMSALEARLSMVESRELRVESSGKDRSAADLSTLNSRLSTKEKEEKTMSDQTHASMSRRKLLEAAGTAAAAVAAAGLAGPAAAATGPQNEAEIVDDRLTRKIKLAVKATALADLCAQMQADTGVHLAANPSVADEKVTLFCEKLPLREVMRQLSRPFGYTWLRTGPVFGIESSVFGSAPAPNTQHRIPLRAGAGPEVPTAGRGTAQPGPERGAAGPGAGDREIPPLPGSLAGRSAGARENGSARGTAVVR